MSYSPMTTGEDAEKNNGERKEVGREAGGGSSEVDTGVKPDPDDALQDGRGWESNLPLRRLHPPASSHSIPALLRLLPLLSGSLVN